MSRGKPINIKGNRKIVRASDVNDLREKIGFFCLHFYPSIGGAERSMLSYLKKMSEKYEITVYCFLDKNGKNFLRENIIQIDGIKIIQSNSSMYSEARRYIKEKDPVAIMTMLLHSNEVIDAASELGKSVFYFMHGFFEDICEHYILKSCTHDDLKICPFENGCANTANFNKNKIKYSKCEKIFVNSSYSKDIFCRFFPEIEERIEVLNPYVNIDDFVYKEKKRKERTNVCIVNSSLLKGKNLIINILNRNPDIDFHIIDHKFHEYKDYNIDSLPNVFLYSEMPQKEICRFFNNSDMVLVPTLMSETFCLVACESLVTGTPVVCSNKGNLPNMIESGVNGYLVEDFSLEKWEEAIAKCKEIVITEKMAYEYRDKYDYKRGVSSVMEEIDSLSTNRKYVYYQDGNNDFEENFLRVFGKEF